MAAGALAVLISAVMLLLTNTRPRLVPGFGAYAGPGATGVAKAASFSTEMGFPLTHILDFAPAKDWKSITDPEWLLAAHANGRAQLEYSLPMLPESSQYSLASCARGDYDAHWRDLARNLVRTGLQDAIVRPGWEFNGDWYPWAARGKAAAYVGCFRSIVTNMRATAGQRFRFDWNPTLGGGVMPAEQAYPGDGYVDYIGVDTYDMSNRFARSHSRSTRSRVWHDILHGDHGLAFWSRFAAAHHKPMAVPEWGVVGLSNSIGGGDDPSFVNHMFRFMTDPGHHVAYQQYFDAESNVADHRLDAGARFPRSQAAYRAWVRKLVR